MSELPRSHRQAVAEAAGAARARAPGHGSRRASSAARAEPIAIIGIGCRFPAAPTAPRRTGDCCATGRDAIREVPRDRWDVDAYYDPDPDAPGKMATRWGGFLDDVDRFDAAVLRHRAARGARAWTRSSGCCSRSPGKRSSMPGSAPDRLAGTRTGVFVGICNSDYFQLADRRRSERASTRTSRPATRTASRRAASRTSSACRARACRSTPRARRRWSRCTSRARACAAGECRMALAGGVNADAAAPSRRSRFRTAHMLAPDGRCKAFDARADGFVRGEGCGVVVLKRLADAQADGDRVLAVIRGTRRQPGRPQQRPHRAERAVAGGGDPRGAGATPASRRRRRLRRGARHRHVARRSDRGRRRSRAVLGAGRRRGSSADDRLGEDEHRPSRGRRGRSPA